MREPGFYWVRDLRYSEAPAEIAQWVKGVEENYWLLCGTDSEAQDIAITVLSPELKPPSV